MWQYKTSVLKRPRHWILAQIMNTYILLTISSVHYLDFGMSNIFSTVPGGHFLTIRNKWRQTDAQKESHTKWLSLPELLCVQVNNPD